MYIALAIILIVVGLIALGISLATASSPEGNGGGAMFFLNAGATFTAIGLGLLIWRVVVWIGVLHRAS